MKTVLFVGELDPITKDDVALIKYYRQKGYDIYIHQLSKTKRAFDILKASVKPYKYIRFKEIEGYDEKVMLNAIKFDASLFNQLMPNALKTAQIKAYYYPEVLSQLVSKKRYNHSLEVAKLTRVLARRYHLDEAKAYLMGLMHDVTKELDIEDEKRVMDDYYKDRIHLPQAIHHQYTACFYLKKKYGIHDHISLNAIASHTTGHAYDLYSMILYVADKIEPTRSYDTSYFNKLAQQNIVHAFKAVKHAQKQYLLEEGVTI